MKKIGRFVLLTVIALLAIVCAIPIIIYLGIYGKAQFDDLRFARTFFEGKVEITDVIASKRWFDINESGLACTYAVVEISDKSSKDLFEKGPAATFSSSTTKHKKARWSNDWEPTPHKPWPSNYCREGGAPLPCCLKEFGTKEEGLLLRQLLKSGSWYFENGEYAGILSPAARRAVTIRYGD